MNALQVLEIGTAVLVAVPAVVWTLGKIAAAVMRFLAARTETKDDDRAAEDLDRALGDKPPGKPGR